MGRSVVNPYDDLQEGGSGGIGITGGPYSPGGSPFETLVAPI